MRSRSSILAQRQRQAQQADFLVADHQGSRRLCLWLWSRLIVTVQIHNVGHLSPRSVRGRAPAKRLRISLRSYSSPPQTSHRARPYLGGFGGARRAAFAAASAAFASLRPAPPRLFRPWPLRGRRRPCVRRAAFRRPAVVALYCSSAFCLACGGLAGAVLERAVVGHGWHLLTRRIGGPPPDTQPLVIDKAEKTARSPLIALATPIHVITTV